MFAYRTMSQVSPVSASVLNTLKRSLSVCLSVAWFRNEVTPTTVAGIAGVFLGVIWYSSVAAAESAQWPKVAAARAEPAGCSSASPEAYGVITVAQRRSPLKPVFVDVASPTTTKAAAATPRSWRSSKTAPT